MLGASDGQPTAIASDAEEGKAQPPAPRTELAGNRRLAHLRVSDGHSGDEDSADRDMREMPADLTGTVTGAGLGRRQTSRGASPHASELDGEDNEEGIVPPYPSAAPPATSEDSLLSRLSQQGGGIAPQALVSPERLRMIREISADDQRR